ncbi:MAG: hypothetical protein H6699_11380 [Myxococcales bacterium]|nr:hypothetical protein [Myxococcales bacterium]
MAPIVVPAGVVPVELTRRYLAENYGRLAYINESCMTFNGAYIIVLMLFGLAAAATAIPRSVRRRRAARAASAQ